ncbi:unnamed protein product [Macrosiphum euphorbiae]|uniref:Uncharacterized protein n=1 Tax=Macrosiphum euphorbiae TaxID=13131 RepID=A0AAV0WM29_9HEMI|nr:unnamed protein product [Macrosiphum euphorbiae]
MKRPKPLTAHFMDTTHRSSTQRRRPIAVSSTFNVAQPSVSRTKSKAQSQLMGHLLRAKVYPSKLYLSTGLICMILHMFVDHFTGEKNKVKAYIADCVCFSFKQHFCSLDK